MKMAMSSHDLLSGSRGARWRGSICETLVEYDEVGRPSTVLKQLRTEHARNDVYRSAIARETAVLAGFDRFGLPQLLAADPSAARPWIRYRWFPGVSVAMHGRGAGGPLAHVVATGLLGHIRHLHDDHDCVHGDVAASNVLVADRSSGVRIGLIDFGNAWCLDQPWRRAPQLAYQAPEQMRGEAWSKPADIYQTGIVIHEVLTGARPERTDGAARPGSTVPREWCEWLGAVLAPSVIDRPDAGSAAEMVPVGVPSTTCCLQPQADRMRTVNGHLEVSG